MARPAMSCTITGNKEICEKLRQMGKNGIIAARKGVKITALEILNDAKNRLNQNGSRVTSKLWKSGKVTIDVDDPNFTDVIFSGGGDGYTDYAEYVEFGRRAGKMPPLEAITEWVVKKGMADTYSIKTHKRAGRGKAVYNIKTRKMNRYWTRATGIALAIARKIAAKGTPAKPFLFPAFEAKKGNLTANIQKEFDKLNKEMTK